MGLLHETGVRCASSFKSLQMQDGNKIAIAARLLEIDNAREKVKDGTIHGVKCDRHARRGELPTDCGIYLPGILIVT